AKIRRRCAPSPDRAYVHNFSEPDRPRLLTLPLGQGKSFRRQVDELANFIRKHLATALRSESLQAQRSALEESTAGKIEAVTKPFEEVLRAAGLQLVNIQVGPQMQPVIFPVVDGKPVPPAEFEKLHTSGSVPEEQFRRYYDQVTEFSQKLGEIGEHVHEIRRSFEETTQGLIEKEARSILDNYVRGLRSAFPQESVALYLSELVDDVVLNRLGNLNGEEDFSSLYGVNLILHHDAQATDCSIIVETTPSLRNLVGSVDYETLPGRELSTHHMMIRAGSLLRADGGYLILEARDVLSEPGAWKALVRTLRTGRLEISDADQFFPWRGPSLKPEPMPLNTKVILIGDGEIYGLLDAYDKDFPYQFKVLADFDHVIPRNAEGIQQYAGVLARIAQEENLLPFDRSAVASLVEHGARIAAHRSKLTTRFGRLADVAREAAFIAGKDGRSQATGGDVQAAIQRGRERGDLPARRFRELIAEGTISVATQGTAVGQINGLAVVGAGPITYGFPARITATIGPGSAGVINIEREAALSGAIHTKGFYILGGLLRTLLRTEHPLAFSASVAFEQSYGGIDGDSASGAEICCLLSALTEVPLRQDRAMTGAIDQVGNILPVGAVNEKIEGFYDVCQDLGLSGSQGVLIPQANTGNLMLRPDVQQACEQGKFQVYGVATVQEALEILTGMAAGERVDEGRYPQGTLLALAVERAYDYWRMASQTTTRIDDSADLENSENGAPA
ncbi:MAG: ATP-binding protein, partial [Planctomycetota bacterium]